MSNDPSPAVGVGRDRLLIDKIIQHVAELPDRTSPEDWPEAMLVTADELRSILVEVGASVIAQPPDLERWRSFYRALAWMLNDYIGVTDSVDYKELDKRLGYAHEGYHNARAVLRANRPPVPEGMQLGIRCKCWAKERGLNAGTRHEHYDEPPYGCARCECKAYDPAAAIPSASSAPDPKDGVELLQRAQAIVRASVLWKRFIDGTPLENDIACWMVDFAVKVRREQRFIDRFTVPMDDPS